MFILYICIFILACFFSVMNYCLISVILPLFSWSRETILFVFRWANLLSQYAIWATLTWLNPVKFDSVSLICSLLAITAAAVLINHFVIACRECNELVVIRDSAQRCMRCSISNSIENSSPVSPGRRIFIGLTMIALAALLALGSQTAFYYPTFMLTIACAGLAAGGFYIMLRS